MRVLSYLLIFAGLWGLGVCAYQHYRGVTDDPVMLGGRSRIVVSGGTVTKAAGRDDFHRAMAFQWFYAGSTLFLGVVLFAIVRRQDRLDPLSPRFDWKDEPSDR